MSQPYVFADLKPVATYPIEGEEALIYDLPAAIPWEIDHYVSPGNWQRRQHMVRRIMICLTTDALTGHPFAGVMPFDETGIQHPIMLRRIDGASSVVSVLSRLGFEPTLESN